MSTRSRVEALEEKIKELEVLDERLTRLIDKLGLTEYHNIDTLAMYYFNEGILQNISREADDRIELICEYLGVEVIEQGPKMLAKVSPASDDRSKSAKRKYVKSGKYSKKSKG